MSRSDVKGGSNIDAGVSIEPALLRRVREMSLAADRLAEAGDFEPSVLLYERATQQALALPGYEHSGVLAVQSARVEPDEREAELPESVRLARARLRAAVDHKLGELRRQTSERVRSILRTSLLVGGLGLLGWLSFYLWRHRGERDLALGATWTLSVTAPGVPNTGKVTPINWWGDHPGYLFHSDLTAPPSVTVDLGKSYLVSRVEITNRVDCCYERAAGLELWTSLDGVKFSRVTGQQPPAPFRFLSFEVPAQRARFIRLSLPTRQFLHLAEVQVYGK